jgi:hypothetical protein
MCRCPTQVTAPTNAVTAPIASIACRIDAVSTTPTKTTHHHRAAAYTPHAGEQQREGHRHELVRRAGTQLLAHHRRGELPGPRVQQQDPDQGERRAQRVDDPEHQGALHTAWLLHPEPGQCVGRDRPPLGRAEPTPPRPRARCAGAVTTPARPGLVPERAGHAPGPAGTRTGCGRRPSAVVPPRRTAVSRPHPRPRRNRRAPRRRPPPRASRWRSAAGTSSAARSTRRGTPPPHARRSTRPMGVRNPGSCSRRPAWLLAWVGRHSLGRRVDRRALRLG